MIPYKCFVIIFVDVIFVVVVIVVFVIVVYKISTHCTHTVISTDNNV